MKDAEIKDQLQLDVERAEAAAKRRLEAPEISMSAVDAVPVDAFLENYCPECFDRKASNGRIVKAKFHAFTGDRTKHALYIEQGYVPKVINGEHKNIGGDPVYTIDQRIYERMLRENDMRSQKMLGEKRRQDSKSIKAQNQDTEDDEYKEEIVDGNAVNEALKAKTQVDDN